LRDVYDVAVIGGGPAGLYASRFAALGASETLLVEKKERIDGPTVCGEFIPSLGELRKLLPRCEGLMEMYRSISSATLANRTRYVRVHGPSNKQYNFRFEGLVLNKGVFNKTLATAAENAGVELHTATTAKGFTREDCMKLSLRRTNVKAITRANVIIAADGFPSGMVRAGRLDHHYVSSDLALCMNALMTGVKSEEDVVEMYLGNHVAPGGYAWIIPKGGGIANVGLGVRPSRLTPSFSIRYYMRSFLSKHPVASRKFSSAKVVSFSAKVVPVGGQVKRVYADRMMLAGDAAGLVVPINGSGIPTAAMSGRIAGTIASGVAQNTRDIADYQCAITKELSQEIDRGLVYRKAADLFMGSDDLFEIVLSLIGTGNVAKVVKCESGVLACLSRLLLLVRLGKSTIYG